MITAAAKCYNTNCQVTQLEFYGDVLRDLQDVEMGMLLRGISTPVAPPAPKMVVRLPQGMVPLTSLPADHPAILFLEKKYNGLTPRYLSDCYSVGYTAEQDPVYKLARNRIIFPIFDKGLLSGWQGRAIVSTDNPKWVLSSGFNKTFYNGDRIGPNHYPVVAEGIPSSIACGPTGTCLFGKEIDDIRAQEFASRWEGAIIATDPETFLPDHREGADGKIFAHRVRDKLAKYCKGPVVLIRYPDSILDMAKRWLDYEVARQNTPKDARQPPDPHLTVPDPADIGIHGMIELLAQVPRRTVL
jgi:hypothetical protein